MISEEQPKSLPYPMIMNTGRGGKRSHRQESSLLQTLRSKKLACILVFIPLYCLFAIFQPSKVIFSAHNDLLNSSSSKSPPEKKKELCSICSTSRHILKDDNVLMKSIYLKSEKFFNQGGDMKSIGNFLNDNIDYTYSMMDMEFYPEGSDEPAGKDG